MVDVALGIREAISRLNRDQLTQTCTLWRGRGLEFLTTLSSHVKIFSTHMRQSISNPYDSPYTAIVVVNSLFYALFTRQIVHFLENRSDRSDATNRSSTQQKKIYNFKTVVTLSALTALFNIGLSKLSQHPLNRVALLSVTAAVVAMHVLFKSLAIFLRGLTSDHTGSCRYLPRVSSSFYGDLKDTLFTAEDFDELICGINMKDKVIANQFLSILGSLDHSLVTTRHQRTTIIRSIIQMFREMVGERWVKDADAERIFTVVLTIHAEKLSRAQTSNTSLIDVDVSQDANYQALIRMGFNGQQLAKILRYVMIGNPASVLENLFSQIRNVNVLPTADENKALFLECIFSEYKLNPFITNNLVVLEEKIRRVITNLSPTTDRRNDPVYERLLILGFPDKHLLKFNHLCQFNRDFINLFDEFFKQHLTFQEPYSLISSGEHVNFVKTMGRKLHDYSEIKALNLRQILECMRIDFQDLLSYQRVLHFGFTQNQFIPRMSNKQDGLDEIGFLILFDSCLLPHYANRRAFPGSKEEIRDFQDYMVAQFRKNCSGDKVINVNVISQRLKSIVDHAITHPESYQKHNLYLGEPGFTFQEQHGTFAQKSAADRAAWR